MFFDDDSANPDIREAVRNASAVRKALKEQEAEIAARRAAASLEEDEDGADHAPASSQHASRTVASTRTIASPRGGRRSYRRALPISRTTLLLTGPASSAAATAVR